MRDYVPQLVAVAVLIIAAGIFLVILERRDRRRGSATVDYGLDVFSAETESPHPGRHRAVD